MLGVGWGVSVWCWLGSECRCWLGSECWVRSEVRVLVGE